ncbi:MAG: hypothetical protein QOF63_2704 [Thermoanaerobaculia bacterium]|jgi:hypothetical protein|nr:hypothetical protein [Thermoanaerobaculia bacterium]
MPIPTSIFKQPATEQEWRTRNRRVTNAVVFAWQVLGLVAVLWYASSFGPRSGVATIRAGVVGSLLAGGMMFLGFVIGFLFGIPKSHVEEGASSTSRSASNLRTNTNLEQISDWFTKILVGVGLTQVKEIGTGLWDFAAALAPAFGDAQTVKPFIVAVVLYFVLCGFLSGYIWTRMFLAGAFSLADKSLGTQTPIETTPPLEIETAG